MSDKAKPDRSLIRRRVVALVFVGLFSAVFAAEFVIQAGSSDPMVVLGYNDLGMHCMNEDFSEIAILPPYNTLRAQVIDRSGEEPRIVRSGVTVKYSLPTNTHSADKTNFWLFAKALFGTALPPNIGLTGNGLAGTMKQSGDNDWIVTGIPVTPINDSGREDPYPLATITVQRNGQTMARTQAVVPVSWEISCNLCHNTPGISTATDILRKHDRMHGTNLEAQKPVLCAGCHSDNALGTPGRPGLPSLSTAMHRAHAPRVKSLDINNSCYACHPGVRTQCQRDIHLSKGLTCNTCHISMEAVGSPNRRPWIDEPRCGSCHQRQGFEFEEPGKLYRDSRGHQGIHCAACHGSPHAITPTVTAADNVQAIMHQGFAGTIRNCLVCHRQQPDDRFPHRLSDD
ncbi:MAG: hypothetical protein U0Z53_03045 [Blastocatellia bacterium]